MSALSSGERGEGARPSDVSRVAQFVRSSFAILFVLASCATERARAPRAVESAPSVVEERPSVRASVDRDERFAESGLWVFDARGNPVDGYRVHLARVTEEPTDVNAFPQLGDWWSSSPTAPRLEQGSAHVEVPEAGRYWIFVGDCMRSLGSIGPFELERGTLRRPIRLVLADRGRLEGRVTEHDGSPARGVLVAASPGLGLAWTTRTDASGKYAFDALAPGEYQVVREHEMPTDALMISIEHPDVPAPLVGTNRIAPNCVVEGGRTARMDLRLEEPGTLVVRLDAPRSTGDTIDVLVSTHRGGNAFVNRIEPERAPDGSLSYRLPRPGIASVSLDGNLGGETLYAHAPSFVIERGTKELALSADGARIEGRLAAPFRTGEPIDAYGLAGDWKITVQTTCDAEGRFTMPFVPGTSVGLHRRDRHRVLGWKSGDVVRVEDL